MSVLKINNNEKMIYYLSQRVTNYIMDRVKFTYERLNVINRGIFFFFFSISIFSLPFLFSFSFFPAMSNVWIKKSNGSVPYYRVIIVVQNAVLFIDMFIKIGYLPERTKIIDSVEKLVELFIQLRMI